MKKLIAFRLIPAALVACASVGSVALVACTTSTTGEPPPPPANDSGVESSTGVEASTDGAVNDSTTGAETAPDTSTTDSTVIDSPVEAEVEAEAEAAAPSCPPLKLCEAFDQMFAVPLPDGGEPAQCASETTGACPDRPDTWGNDIVAGFAEGPVFTDCNIDVLVNTNPAEPGQPTGLLTADQQNDYENQLVAFALSFLGCPQVVVSGGDGGTEGGTSFVPLPAFGLIPAPLTGLTYTTADLELLATDWSQGIQAAVASNPTGSVYSLTGEQITEINDALACQIAIMPGVAKSDRYNHNICSVDGGTD
jgi:hypothetical protein